jgi:hypothetical protein
MIIKDEPDVIVEELDDEPTIVTESPFVVSRTRTIPFGSVTRVISVRSPVRIAFPGAKP